MNWHFYDKATGLFTGQRFLGAADALEMNIPAGLAAMPGEIDHLSQRVDLDTGAVIDFQPPQPSAEFEWDQAHRRWILTAKAKEAIEADYAARGAIEAAEQMSLRSIRELILDPNNEQARVKLQAVDDAIAASRPKISKENSK
jgi:hypothetical protein